MTRNLTDFMDIEESLEARTPGVWGENPALKHHLMLGVDASGRARIGRFWLRYDDHEGLLWAGVVKKKTYIDAFLPPPV